MTELRNIPNVGERTEKSLLSMGYTSIESLKGRTADELYAEECRLRGGPVDRCQLYLYRAVEYFVNTDNPNPDKCRWWLWKDEFTEPSPCGAVCIECGRFPKECRGCRGIAGEVSLPEYIGEAGCLTFRCCRRNGRKDCGGCPEQPCSGL